MCSNFLRFLFCDSYFRVLVLGFENLENLDLTKISCYTVPQQDKQSFTYLPTLLLGQSTLNDQEKTTGQQLLCILSYVRLELSSLYMYVQRPTYMPSYLLPSYYMNMKH